MKKIILVLIMFTSASNAHASTAKIGLNCSDWQNLDEIEGELTKGLSGLLKSYLVRGIYEGAYVVNPNDTIELYYTNTSYENLVGAVSDVCSNPLNVNILIGHALMIVNNEFISVDKKLIDKMIRKYRYVGEQIKQLE